MGAIVFLHTGGQGREQEKIGSGLLIFKVYFIHFGVYHLDINGKAFLLEAHKNFMAHLHYAAAECEKLQELEQSGKGLLSKDLSHSSIDYEEMAPSHAHRGRPLQDNQIGGNSSAWSPKEFTGEKLLSQSFKKRKKCTSCKNCID